MDVRGPPGAMAACAPRIAFQCSPSAGKKASIGGAYFVGGSLAGSLQGEPRATNDIDVVIELPLGRLRAFVDALGPDFEVDLDVLRDSLLRGTVKPALVAPLGSDRGPLPPGCS